MEIGNFQDMMNLEKVHDQLFYEKEIYLILFELLIK